MPIDSALYLGFGAVTLKKPMAYDSAVAPGRDGGTGFRISFPDEHREVLLATLKLIQAFGTVGGRSRNGWGSLRLEGIGLPSAWHVLTDPKFIEAHSRQLQSCLELEWPHALGLDSRGRPLVWRTKEPRSRWQEVIRDLAEVKIAFRTALKFEGKKIEDRHILAYPVTHHKNIWGSNARVPNQLRFKVVDAPEGGLMGLAFHFPCKLPADLGKNTVGPKKQLAVWEEVHREISKKMHQVVPTGGLS